MDEELGGINPNSFFEQLTEVRETAQSAQKTSNSNLSLLNELRSKVEIISNDLRLLKNEAKDKAFEEEDRKQKEKLENRAKSIAGESQGSSEDIEKEQEDPEKGLLGQIGDFISNLFGGIIGGVAGLAISGIGGLIDLGTRAVSGAKRIGAGIADALTFNMFDFDKKGKPDKKNLSSIMGGDKDYEKNKKKNLDLKKEVKKELEDDLGVGDKEKTYKKNRKRGSGKDLKENIKREIKEELKEELGVGDRPKETGKPILGGIKKTFGGIKNTISNFDGRPGSRETKNKDQEVGATNPEDKDGSYSESFSYKGRFDPATLEFIPDEGSLPPGVPLEKAQQDVYQSKIEMLEFDFRENIMRGMTREEAIKSYGPQSNLYRFKENYNKTLEFGGYELDVGKHYDSIKNSMSGKKKGKDQGQDSSLKGEKRGIKGVIGGVADALTGGFFNFDKRGNTKLQDFAQGTADTFTGGFFDFDKKGDTKFQDFQQGTADTLTGGIFDFDEKGSTKLQRFGQGFMDAVTGNLTDFDRKGGKTVGPTRAITGIADFFTGNMFDLDKRGEFNLFGRGKKKKEESTYSGEPVTESYSKEQELDTRFDLKTGRAYVNGVEVDPQAYAEFKSLSEKEQLDQAGAFVIENRVNKIESDSNEGGLVTPINENISPSNKTELELIDTISQSVSNNSQSINIINQQNAAMDKPNNQPAPLTPKTPPNVSEAEVKDTTSPIPFVNLLRLNSQRYLNLGNNAMVIS